jgi:hypothetical protein
MPENFFATRGLAPPGRRTPRVACASNLLKTLERVKGIEPSSSAWEAVALPLSYTRLGLLHLAQDARLVKS